MSHKRSLFMAILILKDQSQVTAQAVTTHEEMVADG